MISVMSPPAFKPIYRPDEAQEVLGIKRTKLMAVIKSGALEAKKLGKATIITGESLQAFIANLPKAA